MSALSVSVCSSIRQKEGTEAAELPDQIDDETKQNRRLIVEELQSGVLDDYNTSRHGEVMQVLCEGFDGGAGPVVWPYLCGFGRVDGHVYFDAADNGTVGRRVRVRSHY